MTTVSVTRSYQEWDGILNDRKWANTNLSYSFPTSANFYSATYGDYEEPDAGFEALNATQISVVKKLYGEIEAFTGGAVSKCVGKGQRTSEQADGIRSCSEVNRVI
jgi:hypothetical protein